MKDNKLNPAIEAPVDVTEKTFEEMDRINEEYTSEDEVDTDDTLDETDTEEAGNTEEDLTDTEEMPVEEEISEQDPEDIEKEYQKKTRIHNNTILFLDLVRNNYETFNSKYSKNCDNTRLKDFYTINKAFTDLISSLEKTLKTKFMDSDYSEMIKYYVSYNRIYDIIVRMVENFVIDNKDESKS